MTGISIYPDALPQDYPSHLKEYSVGFQNKNKNSVTITDFTAHFSFLNIPVIRNFFSIFNKFEPFYKDLFEWKSESNTHKKVLWGIAISIPILLIFGSLFVHADAVFAEWVSKIFDFETSESTPWRLFRTIAFLVLISFFFYTLISKEHILQKKNKHVLKLDTLIVSIVLALVNILFATFVFIQIKYLFGNAQFVLESNVTFAQYARSGFFELAWVIALAAIMFIFIYRSFSHHTRSKVVDALQLILTVQVGVIAASALKRMNLYQEAFGYTVLRLYVEWFIYFVIAILLVAVVCLFLRLKFNKFFYTSMIFGISALTIVCSINVDYLIARQNISKFIEGTYIKNIDLDIKYLSKLSSDTISALPLLNNEEVAKKLTYPARKKLKELINRKKANIDKRDSLIEFNFGTNNSERALLKLEDAFWNK